MRLRLILVVFGTVVLITVLWLSRRSPRPTPPLPPASPAPPVATARPSPSAGPAPTREALTEHHTTVVVPWESEPVASPTAPGQEPTLRPGPSPTPEVSECVAVQYSTSMLSVRSGHVLVDIRAENRCGRDLAPLEVWFWVGGYRQGDLVQSVRGHPFDAIPRDGDGKAVIGLPGSIDWYDHIEVRVIGSGTP